jgi:hypothetical protein
VRTEEGLLMARGLGFRAWAQRASQLNLREAEGPAPAQEGVKSTVCSLRPKKFVACAGQYTPRPAPNGERIEPRARRRRTAVSPAIVLLPAPITPRVFHCHWDGWAWETEPIPVDQAIQRDDAPLVHLPYEGRALPAFFASQIVVAGRSARLS